MSTPIDDGGPAYPCQEQNIHGEPMMAMQFGLSTRDYFAGQALAGWLASYEPLAAHPVEAEYQGVIAKVSYEMADAMIAARKGVKP